MRWLFLSIRLNRLLAHIKRASETNRKKRRASSVSHLAKKSPARCNSNSNQKKKGSTSHFGNIDIYYGKYFLVIYQRVPLQLSALRPPPPLPLSHSDTNIVLYVCLSQRIINIYKNDEYVAVSLCTRCSIGGGRQTNYNKLCARKKNSFCIFFSFIAGLVFYVCVCGCVRNVAGALCSTTTYFPCFFLNISSLFLTRCLSSLFSLFLSFFFNLNLYLKYFHLKIFKHIYTHTDTQRRAGRQTGRHIDNKLTDNIFCSINSRQIIILLFGCLFIANYSFFLPFDFNRHISLTQHFSKKIFYIATTTTNTTITIS